MANESVPAETDRWFDLATAETFVRKVCPDWPQDYYESHCKLYELFLDGHFDGSARTTLWWQLDRAGDFPVSGTPVESEDVKTGRLRDYVAQFQEKTRANIRQGWTSSTPEKLIVGETLRQLLGEFLITRAALDKLLDTWRAVRKKNSETNLIGLSETVSCLSKALPQELRLSLTDQSAYMAYLSHEGIHGKLQVSVFDPIKENSRFLEPHEWEYLTLIQSDDVFNMGESIKTVGLYAIPHGVFVLNVKGQAPSRSKFHDLRWERNAINECVSGFQQWIARRLICIDNTGVQVQCSDDTMRWLLQKARGEHVASDKKDDDVNASAGAFAEACRTVANRKLQQHRTGPKALRRLAEIFHDGQPSNRYSKQLAIKLKNNKIEIAWGTLSKLLTEVYEIMDQTGPNRTNN